MRRRGPLGSCDQHEGIAKVSAGIYVPRVLQIRTNCANYLQTALVFWNIER